MKADKKRTILFDIDGTIYDDFAKDDHMIITKLFGKNFVIMLIDKLLWLINSLGIITNTMRILRLRLAVYAMLSFKSVKKINNEYKYRYQNLLKVSLFKKETLIESILKGYNVILVTNNLFAVDVVKSMNKFNIIYAKNLKNRRRQIIKNHLLEKIYYVVGDNYTDDIYFAKKIGVKSIYVGNSILKNFFCADYNITKLSQITEILKNSS